MLVQQMNRQDCIALISRSRLARLGCVKNGQPYLVPISYAFEDNHLYSFSLEGQKIDWMRTNPTVCILIDEISSPQEWRSVVVNATFEELTETSGHRAHAWSLLQSRNPIWWVPGGGKPDQPAIGKGARHLFCRFNIVQVTGRQAFREN